MADEELNEEQTEEQTTEEVTEEVTEETPSIDPSGLSKNEPSKGFLSKLGDMLKGKKEETNEDEEVNDEETSEEASTEEEQNSNEESKADANEDDEYEEIDPVLVDAARRYGLSDDDIVRYSEENPKVLVDIKREMDSQDAQEASHEQDKGGDKDDSLPALKVEDIVSQLTEDEQTQEEYKTVLTPLVNTVNALASKLNNIESGINSTKADNERRQLVSNHQTAEKAFDKLSETFSEFEKSEDLPRDSKGNYLTSHPAVKVRSQVWNMAIKLNKQGTPFNEALDDAINCYKGKHGEKAAEEKVLKRLKSRESKISPRRTNKVTVKKYDNPDDRKVDVVSQAMRKAGVNPDE